jgi:xanthine dehydrogenase small subunit
MLPQTRKSTVPTSAQNPIRFILDDEVVSAMDVAHHHRSRISARTARPGRTGTKEGCAEGDCGACTIVLGELEGSALPTARSTPASASYPRWTAKSWSRWRPKAADGALHPVQQAMVDCHASQCGFCTPFVMSLFALYLNEAAPDQSA